MNTLFRPPLLLLTLALHCIWAHAAPDQDPARDAETARRNADEVQKTVRALPPACTLGSAVDASRGRWLVAPKAMMEPGYPYIFSYTFHRSDEPVTLANAALFTSH